MSKLKIIDLNKQLLQRSSETVTRMEGLQNSVQNHLATLKRIEAELIRIARAEAEESRLRAQQEAEQQAVEEAAKGAQEKATAAAAREVEPKKVVSGCGRGNKACRKGRGSKT